MSPPALRAAIISRAAGFVIVTALVIARSVAPLYWSDVYFDADQAVMGLMAKHIAEGRAFPVFQYGAPYVLVIEAYLAAPLLAIAGPSPVALRFVPFAFNLATALLLYALLTRRDAALPPPLALLATAPVALPSLSTAKELTAAMGMNIEALFFCLLVWAARERPILLGVVAAVGIKNREFVIYAVAALLFLDGLRDRTAMLWRTRVLSVIAFATVWWVVGVLYEHSAVMGPGTSAAMLDTAGTNVAVAANAICIAPAKMPQDLWTVASELLPFQWGVRSVRWSIAGHPGQQPPDATWLWIPLLVTLGAGFGRGVWRGWSRGPSTLTWFGLFLVMVGLQAVLVYALTRCGNASFFTIRYTLLSVFIASGALVLAFERAWPSAGSRAIIAVCAVWFAVIAIGHATVLGGFLESPPTGSYRQLASYLDEHKIQYLQTDYWTGYHVAFLTGERVRAITDFDRITEHQLAVRAHIDESVHVWRESGRCPNSIPVGPFYLCAPK